MEVVAKRDNFEKTIRSMVGSDYSIGIHGISNDEIWVKTDNGYELDRNKVREIKNKILTEGIYIQGNRKLLSTVRYADYDSYMAEGLYDAGGVIVAINKTLKSPNGEEIEIGMPNEELTTNRNYDTTSLCEDLIPDYKETSGMIDPMFILGTYDKIDGDRVIITLNDNHIVNNFDCVPQDFFDAKKRQLQFLIDEEAYSPQSGLSIH